MTITKDYQVRRIIAVLGEGGAPASFIAEGRLLVTEKPGKLRLRKSDGSVQNVALPFTVDYGGQGGIGDVIAAPDFASSGRIYLSWVEAGPADTRGAAVGTGKLVLGESTPRLESFEVIWRQTPKVTGRGHFSHRLVVSPDRKYLYIASGERQKMQPAQDPASDLGKVIRLPIDAAGKPSGPAERISMGHRNILGLQFAPDGRLWDLEHGPAGGDELNLVKPGANYGWPVVSEGRHYDGAFIPHHATRPEFTAPAFYWNPVIAPGDFIFYSGRMWPEWKGQALIAALGSEGLSITDATGRDNPAKLRTRQAITVLSAQAFKAWVHAVAAAQSAQLCYQFLVTRAI